VIAEPRPEVGEPRACEPPGCAPRPPDEQGRPVVGALHLDEAAVLVPDATDGVVREVGRVAPVERAELPAGRDDDAVQRLAGDALAAAGRPPGNGRRQDVRPAERAAVGSDGEHRGHRHVCRVGDCADDSGFGEERGPGRPPLGLQDGEVIAGRANDVGQIGVGRVARRPDGRDLLVEGCRGGCRDRLLVGSGDRGLQGHVPTEATDLLNDSLKWISCSLVYLYLF
jgi:hypothetical protein